MIINLGKNNKLLSSIIMFKILLITLWIRYLIVELGFYYNRMNKEEY